MAGEVRLQQVVMNLISNALDAMEDTPGPSLSIRLEPASETVRIVVADSGPGIANADRIFDPFYSTKEVGGSEGMGLGLSISYGLVQSFGGAIEGHNRAGGGAVFTVTLPRPGRRTGRRTGSRTGREIGGGGRGMSDEVLLVEDDPAVREALAQTLDLAGYRPWRWGPSWPQRIRSPRRFPG